MSAPHEIIVLARILSSPADAFGLADRLQRVTPTDGSLRIIFSCIRNLAANGIAPGPSVIEDVIKSKLDGVDDGRRRAAMRTLATAAAKSPPDDDELEFSVQALLHRERKRVLQLASSRIKDAVDRDSLEDAESAIGHAIGALSELDPLNQLQTINTKDYAFEARKDDRGPRMGMGLPMIDVELEGGGRRGDFWIFGGYHKQGKSTLCRSTVVYQAFIRGLDGAIVSREDDKDEVFASLLCRHSRNFRRGGLTYRAFENRGAGLHGDDREAYERTLADWQEGSGNRYGRLDIIVPPEDATILTIQQYLLQLRRQGSKMNYVDIDRLEILAPVNPREQQRVRIMQTLQAARGVSMRFNRGEGIFLISPHPSKQDAFDKALKDEFYTFTSLRETAEAGGSPTAILWILVTPDMHETKKGKIGIAAQRKGGIGPAKGWHVVADLERGFFGQLGEDVVAGGRPEYAPEER